MVSHARGMAFPMAEAAIPVELFAKVLSPIRSPATAPAPGSRQRRGNTYETHRERSSLSGYH